MDLEKLPLKIALIKSKAKVHQLLLQVAQLSATPHVYAVVVSVLEPNLNVMETEYAELKIGTMVRILKSEKRPDLVGKIGYILGGPDKDGNVQICFEDGTDDYFSVGLPGEEGSTREFEIEPVRQRKVVVALDARYVELDYPEGLTIKPGDSVKISQKTSQIIGLVDPQKFGQIVKVQKVLDAHRCIINFGDTNRVVLAGHFAGLIEPGQELVVDPSMTVVLDNLGKLDERFRLVEPTNVSWDDIVGLDVAKKQLIEAIEWPTKYKKQYDYYKKKPIKGILLYGSTGNGKTMLGRAVATFFAHMNGKAENDLAGFIYIKGAEMLVKWVGDPESLIRYAFAYAREYKRKTGNRAVIFFDECDILRTRGTGISTDVQDTIVATWLSETSGLEPMDALVILATNRADILDPAVLGEHRINRKIQVKRPDQKEAALVFQHYLEKLPLAGDSAKDLAKYAAEEMNSEKCGMYRIQLKDGEKICTLLNIGSRAMIAEIVDQATTFAIDRDIIMGKLSGVMKSDLAKSILSVFNQNFSLNHEDDLKEFIFDYKQDVVRIQKLRQGMK